jgi:anti-anti-sigma factor
MATISVRKKGLLTVRIDQDVRPLSVRASGEIDISNARFLEEELRRAFSVDAPLILLDLGQVDLIDSTGLRVLLWAAEHSHENGNRLRIRNGSAAVRKVVEASGVGRLLAMTD